MPLTKQPKPFDGEDWLFEIKHDGFRAYGEVVCLDEQGRSQFYELMFRRGRRKRRKSK